MVIASVSVSRGQSSEYSPPLLPLAGRDSTPTPSLAAAASAASGLPVRRARSTSEVLARSRAASRASKVLAAAAVGAVHLADRLAASCDWLLRIVPSSS